MTDKPAESYEADIKLQLDHDNNPSILLLLETGRNIRIFLPKDQLIDLANGIYEMCGHVRNDIKQENDV